MNDTKTNKEQRKKKPLLFPINIINEIKISITYIYKQLTMSMRRKITFDYTIMYALTAFLTIIIFGLGFTVHKAGELNDSSINKVYELSTIKDTGYYNEEILRTLLEEQSELMDIGIQVTMTSDDDNYKPYRIRIKNEGMTEEFFEMPFPKAVNTFFKSGEILTTDIRTFSPEQGVTIKYEIKIAQSIRKSRSELLILLLVIVSSQIIGMTAIFIIGSYRLKKVFRPIYTMTKTAEKISINDMDAKLDVSKSEYELKDLAFTFNEMLDRIRKDYDKQKRFVSDVSHELRTPISIVNGYARMLERWGKEDEAILLESIDAIKGESKNMQSLVENLLTLVRSDNQSLKFEREYFQMDELVLDIVKDMEMIDEGHHHFKHDIQEPIKVCLDYAKTKQTIRIFMDNAIKYTPEGGKISVKVYRQLDNVVISIEDTGIGIAKEDLPFLFDRFFRSDESRTRETGGHGLGLSIAKAMVLGQKGRIKVKSKENEGSEFVIVLPLSYGEGL